jgi:hypothetical protein
MLMASAIRDDYHNGIEWGIAAEGFWGVKTARQRAEWWPTKRAYDPQPHE